MRDILLVLCCCFASLGLGAFFGSLYIMVKFQKDLQWIIQQNTDSLYNFSACLGQNKYISEWGDYESFNDPE